MDTCICVPMHMCVYISYTSCKRISEKLCLCVCVYIYIYIYIYTHTHTHTYIKTYVCVFWCSCICVYMCLYVCICTYPCAYKHYIYIYKKAGLIKWNGILVILKFFLFFFSFKSPDVFFFCFFDVTILKFVNGFSKEPFMVYRVLSVLIRTIINVMCQFICKSKLLSISTKSLFLF